MHLFPSNRPGQQEDLFFRINNKLGFNNASDYTQTASVHMKCRPDSPILMKNGSWFQMSSPMIPPLLLSRLPTESQLLLDLNLSTLSQKAGIVRRLKWKALRSEQSWKIRFLLEQNFHQRQLTEVKMRWCCHFYLFRT